MSRVLFLGILFILLYCCEKPPTKPGGGPHPGQTGPPEPVLYVGNWGGNEVFVVNIDSNVVVDTIQGFPDWVMNIAVTPGGSILYVCTRGRAPARPAYVYAVDPRTHVREVILDEVGDVYVTPKGDVLIISKGWIGSVDTLSNTISFFDSLNIRHTNREHYQRIAFANHASLLYGVDNEKQLFAYNYETKEVVRVFRNLYDPINFIISPDDDILYVAGGVAFDIEQDTIVAFLPSYFLGSLALSPDGEYLYITDPGNMLDDVPSGKISIFQTSSYNLVGYIDVSKVTGHFATPTDYIVVTSDGKTAYVSDLMINVFVIDLDAREVSEVIELAPNWVAALPLVLGYR